MRQYYYNFVVYHCRMNPPISYPVVPYFRNQEYAFLFNLSFPYFQQNNCCTPAQFCLILDTSELDVSRISRSVKSMQ